MIIRMKSGASFDPAIGRFVFWPLDGPVILDKIMHEQIDNTLFASLDQFVIILSFVENVIFSFEDDAIIEMIEWGNKCKQRSRMVFYKSINMIYLLGFDERNNNECLSARLGKVVQHGYRMASFLQTIELGFEICQEFIEHHHIFPVNGIVDNVFVQNVSALYHLKYPDQFRSNQPDPFRISKDVALRAIDLISCNMRQFMLLFDSTNAPKISAIGRQIVVISPDKQQLASDSQSSVEYPEVMNSKRE